MGKLPKILILINTAHGNLRRVAEAERQGIVKAGGTATIGRIAGFNHVETPMSMGTKALPVVEPHDLLDYDGIIFGVAIGHGQATSSEWRAFWDKTGGIWMKRSYFHKVAGMFVSSAVPGAGKDNIFTTGITGFAHHGMYFVPLGYKDSLSSLTTLDELHGATPWGAGTFSAVDGMREPSSLELQIAEAQGSGFYQATCKLNTENLSY